MATTIMLKKLEKTFVPIDPIGAAELDKLDDYAIVKASITVPRNPKQHNFYFALLKLVCENMEEPLTVEALKEYLKIKLNHVEVIEYKGEVVKLPKSINFASMDQTAFKDYFDRSLNFICAEIIPGLSETKVRNELGQMMGFDYDQAA